MNHINDDYDEKPTHLLHRKSLFSKAISNLLIGVILMQHGAVFADSIKQMAQEGSTFGKELNDSFYMPSVSDDNQLTFPSTGVNPLEFNINELYPGTSSVNQRESSYYFPDSGMSDVDSLKDSFDSSISTGNIGNTATQALGADSRSDNPSIGGMVYQIVEGAAHEPARDWTDDPMFVQSLEVYENMDIISKEFAECTETTSFVKSEITETTKDYRTCERTSGDNGECKLIHNYKASFLEHHSGPYNLDIDRNTNSAKMWIGRVGNDYWRGNCTIYEQETVVKVSNPEAVKKAVIDYAKWDDYMQILIGPPGEEVLVWNGPNNNFPPETSGACELDTSWERNLNVDVTSYFKNIQPNDLVRFKTRVSVTDLGEGYASIKIDYDPSKVIIYDEWTENPSCVNLANGIKEGYATGNIVCAKQPVVDANNCTMVNDLRVCETYLKPAPVKGISPLCEEIRVKGNFKSNIGASNCSMDSNGVTYCPPSNEATYSCQELEGNSSCGFMSSTCVEGATSESGECYLYEDKYDCGFITTTKPTYTASSPDYVTCERMNKPNGNCQIEHEIETKYSSFDVYIAAPGRTWLTVEFDLKNGSHKRISPSDGDTYRANVPTIDYDAVCGNSFVSEGKVLGTWDWVAHGFGGSVDTTVWYRVLEVPSCENGLVGKVQIQDTTQSSSTEHVLGGHFGLSVVSLIGDSWGTEQCIESYRMKDSSFCGFPDAQIIDSTNSRGCKAIYDTSICEGGLIHSALQEPPHPDFTKFTDRVILGDSQCNFNEGALDCFIDANGIEQCMQNNGGVDNTCIEFEQDPTCGFIRSSCLDGAVDSDGNCLVFEDVYDCGFSTEIPNYVADTKYECAGPIRCMGEDCVNPEREQSLDFARVSALLNAAETMGQDANCVTSAENTGSDHDIDVVCTIFGGEEQTCKKAVGGVQNCCEKPKGISLTDYVSLIMGAKKMNTAIMGIEAGSNLSFIKSGYETLTSPITGAYDVISKPFTGLIDNIKGVTDTISTTITDLTDIIKDKIADMFNTVFQTTAQNTGATAVVGGAATEQAADIATTAGEQIVSGAGTVLSVIGTVYTIYAVTMLAIQMIFKCTEDELELNVNRVLKNTHHIGSYCHKKVLGICIEKREAYCVFKSPLSRILQEQVRGQLGMTFGDPENPSCDGLAIEQLGAIDWDLVNLDEWLAILSETGNLKDMNIDMESLTGSGSSMNLGSRDDATERSLERFQDIDTEQIRRDSSNFQGPAIIAP